MAEQKWLVYFGRFKISQDLILRLSSIAIAGPSIGKASRNHWNLVQTALSNCSLGMEADHLEQDHSDESLPFQPMVNSYHWKPFVLSGDGNRQLCQWRYPCSQNLLRNDPPFKVIKKFIVLEGVNLHNWQSAVTKVEWMIQLVVWQHGKGQGRDQEEGDFQVHHCITVKLKTEAALRPPSIKEKFG